MSAPPPVSVPGPGAIATLAAIQRVGVVPIVRTDSSDLALRIVETLLGAELTVAEITMTVPNAIETIRSAAHRFGAQLTLGAGTVTDGDTARRAIDAGAQFVVSPCLVPEVVDAARAAHVPAIPGALTPTEILYATQLGAAVIKVFPVNAMGGPSYIRALRAPFPALQLIPTGGVTSDNAADFIRAGALAVGVGSELISSDLAAVAASARKLVRAIAAARGPADPLTR